MKIMRYRSLKNLTIGTVALLLLSSFARLASAQALVDLSNSPQMPKQVLIDVLIADIAHDKNDEFGIQHEFVDSGKGSVSLYNDLSRIGQGAEYVSREQTGDLGDVIFNFPLTENPTQLFQGFDFVGQVFDVDSGQLFAAIQALSTTGRGEIMSRPSVVTLSGQTANIETGRDVPYLTRQVTARSEVFVTAYVKTGINLQVTPYVEVDDQGNHFVTMDVYPKVSFVSRRREERGILLPVIANREAQTRVTVPSGKTFILGGLYRDNETTVTEGVPGLSKVPLIGGLFRSKVHKTLKSELIITITPTVLDPTLPAQVEVSRFTEEEMEIPQQMQMQLLDSLSGARNRLLEDDPEEEGTAEAPQQEVYPEIDAATNAEILEEEIPEIIAPAAVQQATE